MTADSSILSLPLSSPTTTSALPLTTTFTPARYCSGFTFSSPSYFIWYNEPIVATSITASACYPSQFLHGYSSFVESLSQRSSAPLLGPIVCPQGWSTIADPRTTTYIACCPSGFGGIAPPPSIDHLRPSSGGTCYSDFTSDQWLTVTEYNNHSIVGTKTLSQSTSGQVYAHVIDGIVNQQVLNSNTPAANEATLTTASPNNPTWTSNPRLFGQNSASATSTSRKLSPGSVKGIVIGCTIGGVVLIGLAIFLLMWRMRRGTAGQTGRHEKGCNDDDAFGGQVFEKDPGGDKHASTTRVKSELVGTDVAHHTYHELESPPNNNNSSPTLFNTNNYLPLRHEVR